MRDGNVHNLIDRLNKKIAQIYRQSQFTNTRLVAIEEVLSKRGNIFMALWNPLTLVNKVNSVQSELLRQHDEAVKASQERARQEAIKPSLITPNVIKIVAMVLAFALSGCVTTGRLNRERKQMYDEGYEAANFECVNLQKRIQVYIESLKDRLKLFNQVGSDGNLYPLKPEWKGHKSTPATGKEGWQK